MCQKEDVDSGLGRSAGLLCSVADMVMCSAGGTALTGGGLLKEVERRSLETSKFKVDMKKGRT